MTALDPESREEVRKHFDFFDDDNNGFIDFDEFTDMLDIMGVRITTRQRAEDFSKIDTDCDGRISFDEFIAWWQTAWDRH